MWKDESGERKSVVKDEFVNQVHFLTAKVEVIKLYIHILRKCRTYGFIPRIQAAIIIALMAMSAGTQSS